MVSWCHGVIVSWCHGVTVIRSSGKSCYFRTAGLRRFHRSTCVPALATVFVNFHCLPLPVHSTRHREQTVSIPHSAFRIPHSRISAFQQMPTQHVLPGSIFWLLPKSKCASDLVMNSGLDDGCFDHPALILSANANQATATILIVRLV